MTEDLILVDRPQPEVAVVTLNRPAKYNALTLGLMERLGEALAELAEDARLRALVLTGAGKAFCAGIDLRAVETGDIPAREHIEPLATFPHPVIGAVNGVAVTGGLELALVCDLRVASPSARFADTHSRVGIAPGWGLTARLPQAVGQAWARQMSFTGDFVDAALALQIGLVNEVVEADRLVPRAVELAAAVGSTHLATLRQVREMYDAGRDGTGADALAIEARLAADGFRPDDPGAFAARREAVFSRGRQQEGSSG